MGAADSVPGVSGGTVALITGIYERLIGALKSVDLSAIEKIRKGKLSEFWSHIDGNFLVILLAGVIASLLSLARVITYLMANHPIQLWSFFFGLIIISSILVLREINRWSVGTVAMLFIGIAIAYSITVVTPASTPNALWFIFLSGAIAICAMILPGISGAFLLLLMGKYEYVYTALKEFDLAVISVFALGAITGVLSFSRFINWLLKKYHNLAIATLSGFMIGSLNKIWPWKIGVLFRQNSHGEQVPFVERNILPGQYFNETGAEPFLLQGLLFMATGVILVYVIDRLSRSIPK